MRKIAITFVYLTLMCSTNYIVCVNDFHVEQIVPLMLIAKCDNVISGMFNSHTCAYFKILYLYGKISDHIVHTIFCFVRDRWYCAQRLTYIDKKFVFWLFEIYLRFQFRFQTKHNKRLYYAIQIGHRQYLLCLNKIFVLVIFYFDLVQFFVVLCFGFRFYVYAKIICKDQR